MCLLQFLPLLLVTILPSSVQSQTSDGVVCRLEQIPPTSDLTGNTTAATLTMDKNTCSEANCYWLDAVEQDGTETGRCYQCSQQVSQEACEATGVCIWIPGRKELGGADCTICAGRAEDECESAGCFWDLEGYEGVCSKCPGHKTEDSCFEAGCFWRKIQGVEKCVKCGGFIDQQTCEAAACKWNPDSRVKCGGNPEIFLLPETISSKDDADSSGAKGASSNTILWWAVQSTILLFLTTLTN